MKTLKVLPLLCALLLLSALARAGGTGSIIGHVIDTSSNDAPVDFANVVLVSQGNNLNYQTDLNGFFYATNIATGSYDIKVSYLGKVYVMNDVAVQAEQSIEIDFKLGIVTTLDSIVVSVKKPAGALFNKLDPYDGTLTSTTLDNKPIQTVTSIIELYPSVMVIDDQVYIKGARDGSLKYVIDGSPTMGGGGSIPMCGLQSYRPYLAFIPAKFGDTTGGIAAIETRSFFDN